MLQFESPSPSVWGLAISALVILGAASAQAQDSGRPRPKLQARDLQLLASFDRYGVPDLADKAFVKVWTGQAPRGCCRGRSEPWRFGVLIEDGEESFTVVHDLWPTRYEKAPAGQAGANPRFEKLDFEDVALRHLARSSFRPNHVSWSNLVRSRARPSQNLGLVLLARVAVQRGLEPRAARLLELARHQVSPATWRRGRRFNNQGEPVPRSSPAATIDLESLLLSELPRVLLWSAIDSCGQRALSRQELLMRFQRVIERFPDSAERKSADAYAETLEQMIAEESTQSRGGRPAEIELEDTLLELRAPLERLIWSLRDLHTGHPVYHSSVTMHLMAPGSPSFQLYELGPIAIPSLLKIAEDPRLTRIINLYPRRRGPEGYVLRFGDVALALIARLSGRAFETAAQATEWWEDVEARGRVTVLEDMVREAGNDAVQLASMLLDLDVSRAICAAIHAARSLKGRQRERLVAFVAAQRGVEVDAFLLDEVRRGPDMRGRLTAARTLHRRGVSQWAEPLVAELSREAHALIVRNAQTSRNVIRFVVASGTVRSVEALRRLYPHLSHEEKRFLLESVAALPRDHSDRSAVGEATLTSALGDTSQYPNTWSWEGVRSMDAQMSEMAAVMLAKRLDQTFDLAAPPFERRRRMVELGNHWRARRGLDLLPLPQPPAPPEQAAPEVLAQAEADLLAARWPQDVEKALGAYEELGLSGLASLSEVGRRGELDPASIKAVRRMVGELASTVSEVRVADDAGVLSEEGLIAFQPLVGRTLTPQDLVDLLAEHVEQRRNATLELNLHRDGQGRGISLEVKLQPQATRRSSRIVYSLRIGARFQRSSHYVNPAKPRSGWSRFESRLRQLLEGDAATDGELRLRISGPPSGSARTIAPHGR